MRPTFLIQALLLVHIFSDVFSQPVVEWENTIGGDDHDLLYVIHQTEDKGYILGGFSNSDNAWDKTEICIGQTDMPDYWIVKIDSIGNVEWQNTIGGDSIDLVQDIQKTEDKGYIIGGYSSSNAGYDKTENRIGDYDYWIVKIDSVGNILWQNTIGGNRVDIVTTIKETSGGNYVVGGYSNSDISGDKSEDNGLMYFNDYWVVMLDSTGNIEWENTIGGDQQDYLFSLVVTSDGGIFLGGESQSGISGDKTEDYCTFNSDYWVVKLAANGNIQWQNTIGGNSEDILYNVQQTNDGGYILAGTSWSGISCDKSEGNFSFCDYWIVKIDSIGNLEWDKTIGGNQDDFAYVIEQTSDNGYVVGGKSKSNISGSKSENCLGDYDFWVLKLDSTGNLQWQNTLGGSDNDELHCVEQTLDDGYILGGYSDSKSSPDKAENDLGGLDYWVIKLTPDSGFPSNAEDGNNTFDPYQDLKVYPNPASSKITVACTEVIHMVKVSNVLGEIILKMNEVNRNNFILNVEQFPTGIYLLQFYGKKGDLYNTFKLMKE